jgi:hypothetical protein
MALAKAAAKATKPPIGQHRSLTLNEAINYRSH